MSRTARVRMWALGAAITSLAAVGCASSVDDSSTTSSNGRFGSTSDAPAERPGTYDTMTGGDRPASLQPDYPIDIAPLPDAYPVVVSWPSSDPVTLDGEPAGFRLWHVEMSAVGPLAQVWVDVEEVIQAAGWIPAGTLNGHGEQAGTEMELRTYAKDAHHLRVEVGQSDGASWLVRYVLQVYGEALG